MLGDLSKPWTFGLLPETAQSRLAEKHCLEFEFVTGRMGSLLADIRLRLYQRQNGNKVQFHG